ncbi:MAG TPA: DedA family protein [Polyangia bacterium]|jgi:membrane protein DedA with SNARE-associated domain
MERLQLLVNLFAQSPDNPIAGYVAVFLVLFVCGFGVPIPEDITLVAGGIISGLGYTDVRTMVLVGMLGVLVGDATMFLLGRVLGERVRRLPLIGRFVTPERFAAVQQKFQRYGKRVLFIARFLPGLRSPIFITAGMSRTVPFWRFALLDGFAALISVPLWIHLGYLGAGNREWLATWLGRSRTGVLVALLLAGAVALVVWQVRRRRRAAVAVAVAVAAVPAAPAEAAEAPAMRAAAE